MATLLTKEYKEVSRVGLTYGELVTYAKYTTNSIENNTTTYKLKTVMHMDYYYSWSFDSANAYLDDDHKVYGYTTFYRGDTTIQEITRTAKHNADGSSPTVQFYSGFYASYGGGGDSRPEIKFPKIDRYPMIQTAQDFTDEENPTITYSTIMGFQNATLYGCISVDGTTDTVPYRQLVVEDGTYTFNLTTAERNSLRSATPNSNTLTVTFILKTTAGNTNYYSTLQKNMTIVNADPTYTDSKVELNQKVINLLGTNNAETVVENVSQVQVTIVPTTYKSATMASVRLSHAGEYETKTTSPYVFTKIIKNAVFGVTITDSRGNGDAGLIGMQLIQYTPVKINSYSLKRQNQTSSNIILNLQATYTQTSFDNTANVPVVKWKLDDGSYTTIPSSAYTIDTTNKTLTITNYMLSNILPYTNKGYFSIEISDLLTSSVENDILVIKGIPTFDYGEHDLKVNGHLYLADEDGQNPQEVFAGGDSVPINSIFEYNGSSVPDGYELVSNMNIVDAGNSWKKVDLGFCRVYFLNYSISSRSYSGNGWGAGTDIPLPTSFVFDYDKMVFSGAMGCGDNALTFQYRINDNGQYIYWGWQNKYSGSVTAGISAQFMIIDFS